MSKWKIQPLSGKYYGTLVSDGVKSLVIWTGSTGKVSEREIAEGWREDYCFDHTESDRDYKIACIICDALNKENV